MQERGSLDGGHHDPHVEWRTPSEEMRRRASRSWPEKPDTVRSSRLPAFFRRDPGIVPLVIVGLLAGIVGGAVAFTVASSRGMDALSAGEAIAGVWAVVALALVLFGLARILMFQDWRVAGVLLALVVGSTAGDLVAFQVLPGTTTDGHIELAIRPNGSAPIPTPGRSIRQAATCSWSSDRSSVETVTTRRPLGFLTATVTLSPETTAGPSVPGFILTEVQPAIGSSRTTRHEGPATLSLLEPSGRSGAVRADLESDSTLFHPDVAELLDAAWLASTPPPTFALVEVRWECPQLP